MLSLWAQRWGPVMLLAQQFDSIAEPHTDLHSIAFTYSKSRSFVATVSTAIMVMAPLNQDLCSKVNTNGWNTAMTRISAPKFIF